MSVSLITQLGMVVMAGILLYGLVAAYGRERAVGGAADERDKAQKIANAAIERFNRASRRALVTEPSKLAAGMRARAGRSKLRPRLPPD